MEVSMKVIFTTVMALGVILALEAGQPANAFFGLFENQSCCNPCNVCERCNTCDPCCSSNGYFGIQGY